MQEQSQKPLVTTETEAHQNSGMPEKSKEVEFASSAKLDSPQLQKAVVKKATKKKVCVQFKTESISDIDPIQHVKPPSPDHGLETKDLPVTKKDAGLSGHYPTFRPFSNRLLAIKWDSALREKHRKKLANVKAAIDNSSPKPYKHLQQKLKKLQLEQGFSILFRSPG